MKIYLRLTLCLIAMILMITVAGCTPATDLVEPIISPAPSTLISELATPHSITPTAIPIITIVNSSPVATSPTIVTPTATITPTAISSPTATTTSTATSSPTATTTPTATSSPTPLRSCTTPAQRFEVATLTDIRDYTHLAFDGENTILFDGWGPRPEPRSYPTSNPVQVTPQTIIGPYPGIPSARVIFQAGQIELDTGSVFTRTLTMSPPLNDLVDVLGPPPNGQWIFEQISDGLDIISQSPDGQWQLLQIIDWSQDVNGVWLISQTEVVQLVPYVPSSSSWEWADDSSILWYHHSVYEFGAAAMLVNLASPPVVNRADLSTETPLDATYYRLAFSPTNKTILSTNEPIDPSWGIEDPDELFVIDAFDTDSYIVQTIPGVILPVWNEATQQFILMIRGEDSTDFVDMDGTVLVHVPERVLPFTFALSPSGKSLAVSYAGSAIVVYTCDE